MRSEIPLQNQQSLPANLNIRGLSSSLEASYGAPAGPLPNPQSNHSQRKFRNLLCILQGLVFKALKEVAYSSYITYPG